MSAFLSLFEGYGIELEYMVVDRDTLSVRPIVDEILEAMAGEKASDVDDGAISYSNELTLHVIEEKTNGPSPRLHGLATEFHRGVRRINKIVEAKNAMLLPTAMHPLMSPERDTRLWPHDNQEIYEAYNRIFGCRGHGWSNLQSMHINLPFKDDIEFGSMHAAIRLLLPIMPALSASSPIADGRFAGALDARLLYYQQNQRAIPSISGQVIPEPAFSIHEYRTRILDRIYRDIAPHDPNELLRDDWLNSRGAIARFGRQTIEIRVLDIQEAPIADLAIATLICETLKKLVYEEWASHQDQKSWDIEPLKTIFDQVAIKGESALIENLDYIRLFAPSTSDVEAMPAKELWSMIIDRHSNNPLIQDTQVRSPLQTIQQQGPLARRILRALNVDENKQAKLLDTEAISKVYRELGTCLDQNKCFCP